MTQVMFSMLTVVGLFMTGVYIDKYVPSRVFVWVLPLLGCFWSAWFIRKYLAGRSLNPIDNIVFSALFISILVIARSESFLLSAEVVLGECGRKAVEWLSMIFLTIAVLSLAWGAIRLNRNNNEPTNSSDNIEQSTK